MTDTAEKLEAIVNLAAQMGIEIRREPLGGEGGGLCKLRGRQVLFIDTLADTTTRYERSVAAIAALGEIDQHFVRPDVREDIERSRQRSQP